ncbi:MAG: respiratory nitrate reductase subunit gamma [Syntrophothermus sp.]
MADMILFVIFPYVAVALAAAAGLYRYFNERFSFSSLSSQFLEKRRLFWGSVPWHFGIGFILLAHLLAALFPGPWASLIGAPERLYVLEITGLALGLFTVVGIGLLISRRLANPRIRAITSVMDWVLLAVLLLQVLAGVYTALAYRWGLAWYVQLAAPYLWSLLKLAPQAQYLANLPLVAKIHIFNAWVLVALFPFTRLVHMLSLPLGYLIRPYQMVVWHRKNRPEPAAPVNQSKSINRGKSTGIGVSG